MFCFSVCMEKRFELGQELVFQLVSFCVVFGNFGVLVTQPLNNDHTEVFCFDSPSKLLFPPFDSLCVVPQSSFDRIDSFHFYRIVVQIYKFLVFWNRLLVAQFQILSSFFGIRDIGLPGSMLARTFRPPIARSTSIVFCFTTGISLDVISVLGSLIR